jgi:hypothetical protein
MDNSQVIIMSHSHFAGQLAARRPGVGIGREVRIPSIDFPGQFFA